MQCNRNNALLIALYSRVRVCTDSFATTQILANVALNRPSIHVLIFGLGSDVPHTTIRRTDHTMSYFAKDSMSPIDYFNASRNDAPNCLLMFSRYRRSTGRYRPPIMYVCVNNRVVSSIFASKGKYAGPRDLSGRAVDHPKTSNLRRFE